MGWRTQGGSGGARRAFAMTAGAALAVAALSAATVARISAFSPQQPAQPAPASAASQQAVLQRYCLGCHSQAMKERGTVPIALDGLDFARTDRDKEVLEKVVRKVRTGLMPPPGRPRPDKGTTEAFASSLEGALDRAAAAHPNPGRTEPFHRLNRVEYQNAVRDLLGVRIDAESLLPSDDASYGFDNIAGVLKMSPTLMDRYLSAAQKISRTALGIASPFPGVDYYRVPDDLQQDVHLDGLPEGTRGGIAIRHTFPADGEYVIKVRLARDLNESVPAYYEPQQLEVSLDGERVQLFTLPGVSPAKPGAPVVSVDDGDSPAPAPPEPAAAAQAKPVVKPRSPINQIENNGPRVGGKERAERNRADQKWDVRIRVKAGERQVQAAFLMRTDALDETSRLPFERPYPAGVNIAETRKGVHLRSVEIVGPYNPAGSAHAPSRDRILVCQPQSPSQESSCARTILSALARRAYRRPVAPADLQPLMAAYSDGRSGATFDEGLEQAVMRLLMSPEFLFRVERDPANVPAGAAYAVNQFELASRLSFFLWSSIPDDELLKAAEAGRLRDHSELARQVKRMIADERAAALVSNFAGQWLYLRNLPATGPVATVFPDFDDTLRQAMRRETELFVDSIVREDRSAVELLSANYTFLNERLAWHYGVPNITGSQFRRVTFGPDSIRGGLLGQGSILTVTSHPDRTSPVVRGKWILENLLGTSPPPPPPNVPELKATGAPGQVLSMRQRMVQHRENPACASCHAIMDPIGLALENLDGVGRLRTLSESSEPIDASGMLPDGTAFTGLTGLRSALLTKSDQFVTTLTEKLLVYALGRGVESYDAPAVRAVVRQAAGSDYRLSSLILGIVESVPFQMRKAAS
jgi:hypothetical protein